MNGVSLRNKVAIVTGSRRGIGKSIALALAGARTDIFACVRGLKTRGDRTDKTPRKDVCRTAVCPKDEKRWAGEHFFRLIAYRSGESHDGGHCRSRRIFL